MTMQNHNSAASRFISLLLLTTLAVAASAASIAAPPTDIRQKVLDYSDLDLNSMSGVRRVYARIRKAAEAVCGDQQVTGSRITQPDWRACYDRAVADAVAQLDEPALSAYHQRRVGAAG